MSNHFTRRSFLQGAAALTAAGLLDAYPGARLVRAQAGDSYVLIDFGPWETVASQGPAPGPGSLLGVNELGESFGSIAVSESRQSPALWSPTGKLKRLESGKQGGRVVQVNDEGLAVGYEYASTSGDRRAVCWQDGERALLPDLAGNTDQIGGAQQVSNTGQIVGYLWDDGWVEWIDGVANAITVPSPFRIEAIGGVEESGAKVALLREGNEARHVARIQDGDIELLATLTEVKSDTRVFGIRSRGTVSVAIFGDTLPSFYYLIKGSEISRFDRSREDSILVASGINSLGEVVGVEQVFEGDGKTTDTPFLVRDGKVIDLNSIAPIDSGLVIATADGINDSGQIAGTALDSDGLTHGYLLNPVK